MDRDYGQSLKKATHVLKTSRMRKQEFFAEMGMLLLRSTDLDVFLKRMKCFLRRSFQAESVTLAVKIGDTFRLESTSKRVLPAIDVARLTKHIHRHYRYNEVVLVKDLADESLQQSLAMYHIEVILPLAMDHECVGCVLFGRRAKRYTRRDISLLETMSGELVVAVKNSLAMAEVRQLNETLQQKIIDATRELRISNRQLQRLDAAKDEFISMASHQLRTPLTSIKGYLDMMLEGDLGPINATQRTVLTEAFGSSERMVQLIGDFLSISRLQTGKFVINRQATDLAQLVKDEVAFLKTMSKQRHVKIAVDIDKDIPQPMVDGEKLRQVMMNMIENALYYSKPDTTIKVKLTRDDDDVVFTVKDTGIGVPDAEKANLFSKFFRGSNARKKRPDGTGIGLFLARKVVLAHGGQMVFESKESKGSTFGFRLPVK